VNFQGHEELYSRSIYYSLIFYNFKLNKNKLSIKLWGEEHLGTLAQKVWVQNRYNVWTQNKMYFMILLVKSENVWVYVWKNVYLNMCSLLYLNRSLKTQVKISSA